MTITDTERLDWVIRHAPDFDRDSRGPYINAWLSDGEPGNLTGPKGLYNASGNTYRDCIDLFLTGQVTRIS